MVHVEGIEPRPRVPGLVAVAGHTRRDARGEPAGVESLALIHEGDASRSERPRPETCHEGTPELSRPSRLDVPMGRAAG